MKIGLTAATRSLEDGDNLQGIVDEEREISYIAARACYSKYDWNELKQEAIEDAERVEGFLEGALASGHHSVFEHANLTFYFDGLPKAMAMIFNNEKQYASSEKSARYTVMKDVEPEQKELYDKWMGIFREKISERYPESDFPKLYVVDRSKKTGVEKLSQENARYMTSVFTPTKMVHTVNLRQLNFLMDGFDKFAKEHENDWDEYKSRLSGWMRDFNEQAEVLRIPGLENQTDRGLSFFGDFLRDLNGTAEVEERFGDDSYGVNYELSFAGLAQAHRHRTINYHVSDGWHLGAESGFFVPALLRPENNGGDTSLYDEWMKDLESVSEFDFPQAQLLEVAERGDIEDLRSKAILRLCGHAQYEIMEKTKELVEEYSKNKKNLEDWNSPKCLQGIGCRGSCYWGGKMALERLV